MKSKLGPLVNIIFGVSIRLLGAIASFLSIIILTNSLNKEDNANYFLLISLSLFISVFFRMGSDNLLIKKIVQESNRYIVDFSMYASIILFIVLSSILCSLMILLVIDDSLFWISVVALSSITAINTVIGCAFNGLDKITLSVFLTLTMPSCLFLVFIYALKLLNYMIIEHVYFSILAANLFSLGLSIVLLAILLKKRKLRFSIKIISLKKLIISSSSFFGGSLVQSLYNQIPMFALGVFSTSSEVALFGVASRLSSMLGYINSITSKYIALIHAKLDINTEESNNVLSAVKFITIVQVLTLILFMIFSDKIFSIFGSSYEDAKMTAFFLIFSQILNLFFQNHITSLQVTGKQRKSFMLSIFSLVLLVFIFGFFNIYSNQNSLNTSISIFLVMFISCILIKKRKFS